MALTGETVRVALKKDYGSLVTEEQEAGFAVVELDDGQAAMTLPNGTHEITSGTVMQHARSLPYVLDAQRFARMPQQDRRAFLFGLMGLSAGGPAVRARLEARGCDAKKIEAIMPILRAGFAAACEDAKGRATAAKGAWRAVTSETYGAKKAICWTANKPDYDKTALNTARAQSAANDEAWEALIAAGAVPEAWRDGALRFRFPGRVFVGGWRPLPPSTAMPALLASPESAIAAEALALAAFERLSAWSLARTDPTRLPAPPRTSCALSYSVAGSRLAARGVPLPLAGSRAAGSPFVDPPMPLAVSRPRGSLLIDPPVPLAVWDPSAADPRCTTEARRSRPRARPTRRRHRTARRPKNRNRPEVPTGGPRPKRCANARSRTKASTCDNTEKPARTYAAS
jgi:hypothetical protein